MSSDPPSRDSPLPHLAQTLPDYLAALTARGRSRHTVESTRLDLLQLDRYLGRQSLRSVATTDLRAFLLWLQRQQANRTSSLRRKISTVKGFFQYLQTSGLIAEDPSASLLYPPTETRDPRPLTLKEVQAIIKSAGGPAWTALLTSLLDCGLKRDEAVALRWDDVELATPPTLHIRHRAASQRTRRRTLAMSPRLAAALAGLASGRSQTGAVFGLSPRGIDFIVETCARRAAVRPSQKVTPQMLRDAYACRRVRDFVERERALADDATARAEARREHDRTLLRELGLSDESGAAIRYRRLASQLDVADPSPSEAPER